MNQKKLDFFKLFYPLSRVEKKKKKIPPYISPKRKKRKDDIPVLNNFFSNKKNFFSVLPTEYSEKLQNFNH